MEMLGSGSSLLPRLVEQIRAKPFTLIDIGCSGGLDLGWRGLEPNLRAYGFDPNILEVERLQKAEHNANVEYVAAFVAGRPGDEFDVMRAGRPYHSRNPWGRLAIAQTIAARAERANRTHEQLTQENAWQQVSLADSTKPVIVSDFMRAHSIDDVDFIKIDVDGPDFEILHSLREDFGRTNVLGVGMEVNWIGSDSPSDHTFHNTDRFLRSQGFELYDLTVRKYAIAGLPSRYAFSHPAQSVSGRPLQGDALYLRDVPADYNVDLAAGLPREKFWKLAILFDLFNLPDHLAELLLAFPHHFGGLDRVYDLLDGLVAEKGLAGVANSYRTYIEEFGKENPAFFPRA